MKKYFFLIELVVIIAIVITLFSLLAPSLRKQIYVAQKIKCANHLKLLAQSFSLASEDNQGYYPTPETPLYQNNGNKRGWLWDISFSERDSIVQYYGLTRNEFYCLLNESQNHDNLWTFRAFTVTGYGFTPYRLINGYREPLVTPNTGQPSSRKLVVDAILSFDGINFNEVAGGFPIPHKSSHLDSGEILPIDANSAFADGHVISQDFYELSRKYFHFWL